MLTLNLKNWNITETDTTHFIDTNEFNKLARIYLNVKTEVTNNLALKVT